MDLGVLEGQTRGDYFLNSIFDPSVKQCNGDAGLGLGAAVLRSHVLPQLPLGEGEAAEAAGEHEMVQHLLLLQLPLEERHLLLRVDC